MQQQKWVNHIDYIYWALWACVQQHWILQNYIPIDVAV